LLLDSAAGEDRPPPLELLAVDLTTGEAVLEDLERRLAVD
jgi:hypothetical protein